MHKRKVGVVTGTRAEYGILYPLLKALQKRSSACDLQLIATGTHLSHHHGYTLREIEQDRIEVAEKVEILVAGDTRSACIKSTSLAISGLGNALERLGPDILVVLGDRYEILAAASAALLLDIPVCHIAGGEITEGAFDDSIRHAISKMASIHFTTHPAYSRRVTQMGASPQSVICTGSLAIDNIRRESHLSKHELEAYLNINLAKPHLLLTFHPETRSESSSEHQLDAILNACSAFQDISLIITEPNADPGSGLIKDKLHQYVKSHPEKAKIFSSLGRRNFLSLLPHMAAMIGNSSSGISEAPASGTPTINIGDRQKGRLTPPSIMNVQADVEKIKASIASVLKPDAGMLRAIAQSRDFYGDGQAAEKMADILLSPDLSNRLSRSFHDIAP